MENVENDIISPLQHIFDLEILKDKNVVIELCGKYPGHIQTLSETTWDQREKIIECL